MEMRGNSHALHAEAREWEETNVGTPSLATTRIVEN